MQERRKSKDKFGETKVCKAEKVRKSFINPKSENNVSGQCVKNIFCRLYFRNAAVVIRRCSSEKIFLNISQENTCVIGLQIY